MNEETTQAIAAEDTDEDIAETAEATAESPVDVGTLEAALAERDARIASLEETLALRGARVAELEAAAEAAEAVREERERETGQLHDRLAGAISLYRTALLAAEPDVPEDLVQGATVEELETSMALARRMVEQVRSQLEAKESQERFPLGAPVRTGPNLSALTPQEKILRGLASR